MRVDHPRQTYPVLVYTIFVSTEMSFSSSSPSMEKPGSSPLSSLTCLASSLSSMVITARLAGVSSGFIP